MTLADISRAFIIGGAMYYGIYWWWPESGHWFGPAGVWRSLPRWLRPLVQRYGDEVHFYTVFSELWALSLVVLGVALEIGAIRPNSAFLLTALGAIAAPAVLCALIVSVRLRRRR